MTNRVWLLGVLVGLLGCEGSTDEGPVPPAGAAVQQAGGAPGASGAPGGAGHAAGGHEVGGHEAGGHEAGGHSSGGSHEVGGSASGGGPAVPEVSLRNDLVPLMDRSCAVSACHSSDSYIQPKLGPSQEMPASSVFTSLLTHPSYWLSAGKVVVAGEPEQSPLLRKLTGVWTGLACEADASCGSKMPPPSAVEHGKVPPLSDAEIALFRRWIAEGARDN